MIIQLKEITKIYRIGGEEIHVLRNISLSIEYGEFIAIIGPSGSGKSTLLNIIGCLDQADSGRYLLENINIGSLGEDELATVRNQKIGFVFQVFNLIPSINALMNVGLPLLYAGYPAKKQTNIAYNALASVGLAERVRHRPNELSGGEQQRVAIARAIVNNPQIILADEPTGNLDSQSGEEILKIFEGLNKERNVTIILVTHDEKSTIYAHRTIRLKDGRVEL